MPGAVQAAQEAIAAAKAGASGLQQADASGLQDSTDAMDSGLHAAAAATSGLQQFLVDSGIKQADASRCIRMHQMYQDASGWCGCWCCWSVSEILELSHCTSVEVLSELFCSQTLKISGVVMNRAIY